MITNRIHNPATLRALAVGAAFSVLVSGCQELTYQEPAKEPDAVTLVRDGTAAATIVVSARRSKVNELAVKELNDHLEKITGARLPVVTDDQAVTGSRVLVGESEATKALGLNSADFKDQEYLVQATPDTLVLMGKDDFEAPASARSADDVWVAGKWGKALAFNGQDTLFTAKDHGFNDAEGTLECWVNLDKPGDGTVLRLSNSSRDKHARDHVILQREGNRLRYRSLVDGRENFLLSKALAPGWHHVLATHSASAKTLELIVDGVSQGTAPYVPTSLAKSTLYIGGFRIPSHAGVWTPLRGIVDDIRVSRVVRPGTTPAQPLAVDADTTLLLSCDEGAGAPTGTVRDASGEGLARLPKLFSRVGTLNAIYDFLENDCGVRWYAPGELGVVVDKASYVGRPAGERRRSPAMSYLEVAWAKAGYEEQLWSLRMRTGGDNIMQGQHSFTGYYDRFSKAYGRNPAKLEADRPEFFAKGLTEEQMHAPAKPGGMPNLCYSSPALVAQVVQDARDYFDGKGVKPGGQARGDYFALGPMDMAPYCKCADCQAVLQKPADAIDRGFASTYWYGFVNRIAKELRKTHPDKILPILAYADFVNPPEGFVLEPNVSVTFCALGPSMWWDPARRERDRRAFDEGWAKINPGSFPLYGWLYYLGGMMGQTDADYPDACAFQVPAYMKSLHAAGMRGLFIQQADNVGYSFLMSQLELYLTLKLADDPTLDGNALIDEFFTRYYGEAGPMMKQLYAEMEAVKFDLRNYPEAVQRGDKYNLLSREIAYRHLVTPERAERWSKLMDTALATATGAPKERVQRYKTEVWDRMMTARAKYLSTTTGQPK